jgi:hypothetical protein
VQSKPDWRYQQVRIHHHLFWQAVTSSFYLKMVKLFYQNVI